MIRCDANHPLANREYLFPFVSVVEVAPDELPDVLGHSLVVTGITDDRRFERLVTSPLVDRLNIGAHCRRRGSAGISRTKGNLFEHLYARRAIQRVA